jgi:exodeoxyribonuclease VII small subunit
MPKTSAKDGGAPASFETALGELEQIVGSMEGGQLTLEASLAGYRRGAELLKYCQDQLQAVQDQVKVLEGGVLKEFTLDAAGTRTRARSADGDDDIEDA